MSLKFKKQYSTPLSNSELIPGFFLNSLIKLLRVKVDMSKFNKSKKMFKEEGIITEGFVGSNEPKVKSYYKLYLSFSRKNYDASRSDKKDQIFTMKSLNSCNSIPEVCLLSTISIITISHSLNPSLTTLLLLN